jgi:hypothetical protein
VKPLFILLSLFLFSFTYISCSRSSDSGSKSTDNTTTTTTTDTTSPTVSSSSPSDGGRSISIRSNVSVTFSETMDKSSVTTNTFDTSCFGTFQVSSDGFNTCIQMYSSPTRSNSNKTFTVNPIYRIINSWSTSSFSYSTIYRIRITTGVKDSSGNSLTSQWTTSSGFRTENTDNSNKPVITSMTGNRCSINIKGEDDYGITHFIVSKSTTIPSVTSNNWWILTRINKEIDIDFTVYFKSPTRYYVWLKDTGNNKSTRGSVNMTYSWCWPN